MLYSLPSHVRRLQYLINALISHRYTLIIIRSFLKSQIGHSFNRIWFRIKEHFINLVAEKSLNKEMADLAFILLYGRPLGIFGTMDIIGLQTAIDIRHVWHSHGACDTEMPDFVQEMVKAQQTFYGPCTKNHCPQKNIEELWSTRSANLERMEQYSRNHDLYHVQWRSFTDKLITDVLRLKERFPVDSIPTDIQVMEYLEQSPELKFTMFLIASVTVKEYRHTVIENEVIAPETMKTLLSKLDINEHLFEEMNNHFPDSSGITAKKKEEL
ncbi:MAG: 3-hydroxyacyl-CoA dehydrogenase family protein [Endozoicomonas sp.]